MKTTNTDKLTAEDAKKYLFKISPDDKAGIREKLSSLGMLNIVSAVMAEFANSQSHEPKQVLNVTDEEIILVLTRLITKLKRKDDLMISLKSSDMKITIDELRSLLSPVAIEPDGWLLNGVYFKEQPSQSMDGEDEIIPVYFSPSQSIEPVKEVVRDIDIRRVLLDFWKDFDEAEKGAEVFSVTTKHIDILRSLLSPNKEGDKQTNK